MTTTSERDIQVGGNHYRDHKVQPWDVMREYMTEGEFRGFLWGNIIKYMLRWRTKGGLEDLRKAEHYLSKLIKEADDAESDEGKPVRSAEALVPTVWR